MFRSTPPNPYGQGPPFQGGEGFRPHMPPPRFQSSPRCYSPATGQQRFVSGKGDFQRNLPQHHRSPRHRSPRGDFGTPVSIPYNYDGSSPYLDRSGSGSGSPSYSSPSSQYNRGARNNGNGRGRYKSGNRDFTSPRGNEYDNNPGGSNDIRQYYSPKMVQDPWSNLVPLSTSTNASSCST